LGWVSGAIFKPYLAVVGWIGRQLSMCQPSGKKTTGQGLRLALNSNYNALLFNGVRLISNPEAPAVDAAQFGLAIIGCDRYPISSAGRNY
jgi:hypothetical protein